MKKIIFVSLRLAQRKRSILSVFLVLILFLSFNPVLYAQLKMDSYGYVGINADPAPAAPLYVFSSGAKWSHCVLAGTTNSLGTAFGMYYKYAAKGDGFYVNSQWLYSHGVILVRIAR